MSIKSSFFIVISLCLLGFIFSSMAVIDGVKASANQESAFCISKDDSCSSVLNSPYSVFLGIPLSKWGVVYFMLVVLILLVGSKEWLSFNNSQILLTVVVGLGLLFSLYLISIMSFVLHTVCSSCLMSHTSNILMAGFLFRHLKKYDKIL